ncbi:RHS repeat-associated core domain-containing protein [Rapidithrix thailandica]|uniref:RHS repeat-associated core domain-containing protein n=1 Tax=Rapidithrix thailandica TaxID=413964 RepID=A0AAW9SGX3_9BACT
MYNHVGNLVWQAELDIYGKIRTLERGSIQDCPFQDCPFRNQGQYEDVETGLYYNRFRYYSPESGTYISQDPIGLAGNNPNIYAYVHDSNAWVDVFGLSSFDPFSVGEVTEFPKDIYFGQDRIAPNFSSIGSQADDVIIGQSITDVSSDIKAGKIDPNVMVISYTVDPATGKNVTLNNRGLAAIVESGKTPDMTIKVPYDRVPPHLVADIKNRPPSKTINITKNKDGSGFLKKVNSSCK